MTDKPMRILSRREANTLADLVEILADRNTARMPNRTPRGDGDRMTRDMQRHDRRGGPAYMTKSGRR